MQRLGLQLDFDCSRGKIKDGLIVKELAENIFSEHSAESGWSKLKVLGEARNFQPPDFDKEKLKHPNFRFPGTLSPNGRTIAILQNEKGIGGIKLSSLDSGEQMSVTLLGQTKFSAANWEFTPNMTFSEDGKRLICGLKRRGNDQYAFGIAQILGDHAEFNVVAFDSGDSYRLLSLDGGKIYNLGDKGFEVWDLKTKRPKRYKYGALNDLPREAKFLPDKQSFVFLTGGGELCWVRMGEKADLTVIDREVTSFVVDHKNNRLIIANGNLCSFDLKTGQKEMLDTVYYPSSLALSPDGRYCFSEPNYYYGKVEVTDLKLRGGLAHRVGEVKLDKETESVQEIRYDSQGKVTVLTRDGKVYQLGKGGA